jgi:glycine cleavage system aminomethyltransferase T
VLVGLTVSGDDVPESVKKLAAEFEMDANNYDETGLRDRAAPVAQDLDLRALFEPKTELLAPDNPDGAQKSVGWLTSVIYSPQLKKPLFLGYVRRELADEKKDVRLGEKTRLKVVDLPTS